MSFYGYRPDRYSTNYGAQAVSQIGSILSSAIQQYPQLKQVSDNKANNKAILDKYKEQFGDPAKVHDAVFAGAGTTREQFLASLDGADLKKDNTAFLGDLFAATEPLKAELNKVKGLERQRVVSEQISTGAAGGQVLGTETEVPMRYQPGGGSFTEQDILADQKPATTRGEIARNIAEREQLAPSGRPLPTTTEAEQNLQYSTTPTTEGLDKQKYFAQKEARLAETLDFKKAKNTKDLSNSAERLAQGWKRLGLSETQVISKLSDMVAETELELDTVTSSGSAPTYDFDPYTGKWAVVGSHIATKEDYQTYTDKLAALHKELAKWSGAQQIAPVGQGNRLGLDLSDIPR